jgi:hypothetical protein
VGIPVPESSNLLLDAEVGSSCENLYRLSVQPSKDFATGTYVDDEDNELSSSMA